MLKRWLKRVGLMRSDPVELAAREEAERRHEVTTHDELKRDTWAEIHVGAPSGPASFSDDEKR